MAFYVSLGRQVLKFAGSEIAKRFANQTSGAKFIQKPTNTQIQKAIDAPKMKLVGGMLKPVDKSGATTLGRITGNKGPTLTATQAALDMAKEKKSGSKYHPDNEKMDRTKMKGLGKAEPPKRLSQAKPTKLEEAKSDKIETKTVPTPRARPKSKTPTPRKRPSDVKSSGSTLKNNLSMDKDKMANSIAAARKRGEGYYFDKKTGKKQLAIYKNDMKEGESLRDTANRLLGLKRKK